MTNKHIVAVEEQIVGDLSALKNKPHFYTGLYFYHKKKKSISVIIKLVMAEFN